MSHCTNNGTKTGRKLLLFVHFLGSVLAPFRPSGPLCFPVRQGAFSASGGRAVAATGAAGGFYVSLYNQWYQNWSKTTIVFLGFQKGRWALFGLDFGAVPSFRATVFPCPAGCVLSLGRKSSSSNRSSRRVLCLIVQTAVQKLVENYCFSRVSEGTLGQYTGAFFPGSAALRYPARGPLAVSLPYGSSLLSVGERGRRPSRRPTRPPKTPAFYGVLCASHFFPFFGSCGLRWVNMGQHRPQDGPT